MVMILLRIMTNPAAMGFLLAKLGIQVHLAPDHLAELSQPEQ